MDPLTAGILGSAAGNIGGSLLGGLFGGGDSEKSEQAMRNALAAIQGVNIDKSVANELALQSYLQGGTLTPQQEQALQLSISGVQDIQERPENRQQQVNTLNILKQLSQTGLGLEDKVAARQLQREAQQNTTANQADILRQAMQRGQMGGGDALAAALMSNQQGAQQGSEIAAKIGAQASDARQNALARYLGGQENLRSTDLSLAEKNKANELAKREFEDRYMMGRSQRNVDRMSEADKYNLARQQGVSDKNVGTSNEEKQRQVEAKKWINQMELQKAQAMAGQYGNQSGFYGQKAANTQQSWSNIGQGLGSVAGMGLAGGFGGGGSSGTPTKQVLESSDDLQMPTFGKWPR